MADANTRYGGNAFPGPSEALMSGGGGIPVPDVTGRTAEEAQTIIEGLGFEFVNGGDIDSDVPAGRVGATDPGPGADGVRGQTVVVLISRGNLKVIPDAISGSDDYNEARGVLQAAGFNNIHQACVEVIDPTKVDKPVAQNPPAGTAAAPNVNITVGVGKLDCP
jgi:beta-lactam-binding protein with PASTA domain